MNRKIIIVGFVLLPCFLLFARVGVDSDGNKNIVSGLLDLNGNVVSNASFANSDGGGLTNLNVTNKVSKAGDIMTGR